MLTRFPESKRVDDLMISPWSGVLFLRERCLKDIQTKSTIVWRRLRLGGMGQGTQPG